jgi:hypothetical protein
MVTAKLPTLADPLSEIDLRDLNRAQYILAQLIQKLERAKEAGRDVTDIEIRRDQLAAEVEKLKRVYFPSKS